jgi:DNA polymerase III delta subunit
VNYHQWRRHADKGQLTRVTWCCGSEPVLRESVVDVVRRTLAPAARDDLQFDLRGVRRHEPVRVWDELKQFPVDRDAVRLIQLRGAELLPSWIPLASWLAQPSRRLARSHLLLVSDQAEPPGAIVELHGTRRSQMRIVRCGTPRQADLVWWIRSMAPMDEPTAEHLAQRLRGNLAAVRDVCATVRLFPGAPTARVVDALCREQPAQTFVERLLMLRRTAAIQMTAEVPAVEYRAVLGLLASRLGVLEKLYHAVCAELSRREIAALDGVPYFLANQFLPVARHYSPDRCARRRALLAVADDATASGARDGVLEALVASWV